MREFQGWTPETIDNRTFDQLEAIFAELSDYRRRVPSTDVSLEGLKQVVFKHLGVKEGKGGDIDLSGIPSVKMTGEETDAWMKAGYPSPVGDFIANYRKEHRK